ncbi:hypothetical protein Sango_1607000 [Sesamum angolense]|uniref:RanBP2-type domain-containing protein n=1 Tax=Sesamum angolense TaxID=2727404 RepID=A0AAE1WJW9_9LAMI|nr:hypothetical protein Sango_1607000 [Sesamum angolense]
MSAEMYLDKFPSRSAIALFEFPTRILDLVSIGVVAAIFTAAYPFLYKFLDVSEVDNIYVKYGAVWMQGRGTVPRASLIYSCVDLDVSSLPFFSLDMQFLSADLSLRYPFEFFPNSSTNHNFRTVIVQEFTYSTSLGWDFTMDWWSVNASSLFLNSHRLPRVPSSQRKQLGRYAKRCRLRCILNFHNFAFGIPSLGNNLKLTQEIIRDRMSRQGDWMCAACQHLNFQKRDSCQRCSCPKYATGVDVSAYAMQKNEVLAGDWYCGALNCGAHNYASRTSCYRCCASKDYCGYVLKSWHLLATHATLFPVGKLATGFAQGRSATNARRLEILEQCKDIEPTKSCMQFYHGITSFGSDWFQLPFLSSLRPRRIVYVISICTVLNVPCNSE